MAGSPSHRKTGDVHRKNARKGECVVVGVAVSVIEIMREVESGVGVEARGVIGGGLGGHFMFNNQCYR